MVTIRDVAEKAGVSIGTVSRVLNNKTGVSKNTRRHIIEITQELGYSPHKRVPFETAQVTHLGLVIRPTEQPLTSDPFYGGIFHGVEKTCQEYNISVSFSTLDIKNNRLRKLPAMINDERISGLVLLGALPLDVVVSIDNASKIPIVLIDNWFPDCKWDSVMIENVRGAYKAVINLIAHGHKHIVMMAGPKHPSIIERQEGFEMAMREHKLNPIFIKPKNSSTVDSLSPSDGENGIVDILRQAPQTTAVFCSNDNQAIGAIISLHKHGIRVPEDVSIVGFDNIGIGQYTTPPITTIHVDRGSLGKLATQILMNRINNPDRALVRAIISTKLVERESVGPPRTHIIEPIGREN
ncbi:MAG: LacI family transcriptional regulator [Anaerolineales bacterium]|nr:LacI family transcriptional regulator [Anaerolineales bacterium]